MLPLRHFTAVFLDHQGRRRRGALQTSSKMQVAQLPKERLNAFCLGEKKGSGGQQALPYVTKVANSRWLCNQEGEKPLDMTYQNT